MELTASTPDPKPRVVNVSLDETLKRMKAELRREFPGTKFSVRRSRGTGYGYVYVGWTDGPKAREVSAITDAYEGAGFDGMTDSSYSIEHVAADAAGAPVILRYGTKGINCERRHSPAEILRVLRLLLERCADSSLDADERIRLREMDDDALLKAYGSVRLWDEWLSTLCYRALEDTDGRFAFLTSTPDTAS